MPRFPDIFKLPLRPPQEAPAGLADLYAAELVVVRRAADVLVSLELAAGGRLTFHLTPYQALDLARHLAGIASQVRLEAQLAEVGEGGAFEELTPTTLPGRPPVDEDGEG